MSRPQPVCERCGEPALVHITSEASSGPTMRHLCLRCADAEQPDRPARDRFLNYGAILFSLGAFVVLLSAFADVLRFGRSEGFGPRQAVGLGIALVCIFTAAIVRVPTLMVFGILAGGLTILADVLKFGHGPGFGWNQMLGVAVGLALILSGYLESRRPG